MNNPYNQFQNEVATTANSMMTQMLCAQNGIDYGTLVQTAEQAKIQGILTQEQNRQMDTLVRRHYGQGNGILGKLKNAFNSPTPSLLGTGFGMSMPAMQVIQPIQVLPQPPNQNNYGMSAQLANEMIYAQAQQQAQHQAQQYQQQQQQYQQQPYHPAPPVQQYNQYQPQEQVYHPGYHNQGAR